jgi:hypothetical protein
MDSSRNKHNYDFNVRKFEGGIHSTLTQDSFNFVNLKGQGAFGKVYKVKRDSPLI